MGITRRKKKPPEGKKYALLIGVGNFKDPSLSQLPGVPIDIKNFANILRDSEYNPYEVVDLLDGDLIETKKAITDISTNAEEEDIIFFYYSGHGVTNENQTFFFVLRDSESKYLDATCLESDYVLSQFRKSKCTNFVIVIDACYSGAFFNNNRGLPKGLFTLTSSRDDQVSLELFNEGGLFTSILVKGLKSEYIDANRDGRITFSEIFNYLVEETSKQKLRQQAQKWEWNVDCDLCLFDSPRPVFISYKRQQTEFVTKLSNFLKAADITTFVDQEKLRVGDNWKEELEKTIINSRVFLMVMDKAIMFSEVSNWELKTAFKHNIPILPIMIEELDVHAMFELEYGHINRFTFDHDDFNESAKTIVDHIKSLRVVKKDEVSEEPDKTR